MNSDRRTVVIQLGKCDTIKSLMFAAWRIFGGKRSMRNDSCVAVVAVFNYMSLKRDPGHALVCMTRIDKIRGRLDLIHCGMQPTSVTLSSHLSCVTTTAFYKGRSHNKVS